MVEEIITALSRIRWLFVIARNSSFTYKGQAIDVKRVGRELGVRYVLEGSVRKSGNRVRITTQLIDATNGAHLWADHFDGSLETFSTCRTRWRSGSPRSSSQNWRPRKSGERWIGRGTIRQPTILYLRALRARQSWEKKGFIEALDQLNHATRLDATYGPALALSAWCHMVLNGNGWSDDPGANR